MNSSNYLGYPNYPDDLYTDIPKERKFTTEDLGKIALILKQGLEGSQKPPYSLTFNGHGYNLSVTSNDAETIKTIYEGIIDLESSHMAFEEKFNGKKLELDSEVLKNKTYLENEKNKNELELTRKFLENTMSQKFNDLLSVDEFEKNRQELLNKTKNQKKRINK